MRKDLKSMAMAMGKIRNPITPPPELENKMREERYKESLINTDFGNKIEAIRVGFNISKKLPQIGGIIDCKDKPPIAVL